MTRIQLENYGEIIIQEGTNFPLNFNIQDLTKPESTPSNYSKDIVIVGDNDSNKILGHAYDVNVSDSTFDINKKVRCNVIQDDNNVFENALFQLLKVETSEDAGDGQTKIKYTARVKSSKMSFFTDIKNKDLSDLKIGDSSTFQYLNKANIEASFGNTASSVWKYIPMFKESTIWKSKDFRPGIFVKSYWDKIHSTAGWEYEFGELEDVNFDKLIIPYTGKYEPSEKAKEEAKLKVDNNKFQQYDYLCAVGAPNVNQPQLNFSDPISIQLDNITQDNFNQYSLSNEEFTANFSSEYTFEYTFNFSHILQNFTSNVVRPYNGVLQGGSYITYEYELTYQKILNNGAIVVGSFNVIPGMSSSFDRIDSLSVGNNTVNSGVTTVSFTQNLLPGEKIRNVSIRQAIYSDTSPLTRWVELDGSATPAAICSKMNFNSVNLEVIAELNYDVGAPISIQDFVPRDVKQSEFIKSIINMYRLVVEVDPDQENKLIYTTRDKYYDNGEELDWTDKISQNKPKNIEWLVNKQKKERKFTYKLDEDNFNKSYFNNIKDVYGEYEYDFGNDYNIGQDKIELIFSPTPTIYNQSTNMYLPGLVANNDKESNIRILYDGGERTGVYYFIQNDDGTYDTNNNFTYPHITHMDDSENPGFDLNFGVCEYYYYNNLTVTNNNLWNLYHRRTTSQQSKGRIMTAFFYLTPIDILNFKLNSRIFIIDSWWNVNRIIDYNANNDQLTKVELVTVDDGISVDVSYTDNIGISRPSPADPWVSEPINETIDDNVYNDNTISAGSNVYIKGTGNVVSSGSKGMIIGDNNISSSTSMIIGDSSSDNGLPNKLVVGNDKQATEEYDAFIGDIKIGESININETDYTDVGMVYNSNYVESGYINDGYFTTEEAGITFGQTMSGTSSISIVNITGGDINLNGVVSINGTVSGITLEDVLSNGNTTGGNDILIDNGDKFKSNYTGVLGSTNTLSFQEDIGAGNIINNIVLENQFNISSLNSKVVVGPGSVTTKIDDTSISYPSFSYFSRLGRTLKPADGKSVGIDGYALSIVKQFEPSDLSNDSNIGEIIIGNNSIKGIKTIDFFKYPTLISTRNSEVESGVENSVILGGEDITATQSNTVYTPTLNVKDDLILATSSSIINLDIEIEYASLATLKSNSELEVGRTYHITDRDIWIKALGVDELSLAGSRRMRCPLETYYTPQTVVSFNNIEYLGIYGQTIDQGSVPTSNFGFGGDVYRAIWGGKLWQRDSSGADGGTSDNATIDGGGWTQMATSGSVYEDCYFSVLYNFDDDVVSEQRDWKGNIIINTNLTSQENIDITDWNNSNIYANFCYGIYNNYRGTSNVAAIGSNNILGGIYNNSNDGAIIENNITGSIHNNSNDGNIIDNTCGSIDNNSNDDSIDNNSNIIRLYNNSNSGSIKDNSNTGFIEGNSNNGTIIGNSNNGTISDNSNSGSVSYNYNSRDIFLNSNDGNIRENNNNGTINSNSNSGDVINNSNSGNISVNSNVGDILENVNAGDISLNSNQGRIELNSNNGDIENNSMISPILGYTGHYIVLNDNGGDISNNTTATNYYSCYIWRNKNNGTISNNTFNNNSTYIRYNNNNGNISRATRNSAISGTINNL